MENENFGYETPVTFATTRLPEDRVNLKTRLREIFASRPIFGVIIVILVTVILCDGIFDRVEIAPTSKAPSYAHFQNFSGFNYLQNEGYSHFHNTSCFVDDSIGLGDNVRVNVCLSKNDTAMIDVRQFHRHPVTKIRYPSPEGIILSYTQFNRLIRKLRMIHDIVNKVRDGLRTEP